MAAELCPACGMREQNTPSGLCSTCVVDKAAVAYAAEDRRRVQVRIETWRQESTPQQRYNLLRSRRRTILDTIRPRHPSAGIDPWELGVKAIEELERIRRNRGVLKITSSDYEPILEAIRRLAWGPDDGMVIVERRHRRRVEIPGQLSLWPELEEVVAA